MIPRALAAGPVDTSQLLARADAVRNPSHPFALTTTLLEYKDGRQKASMTLRAFSSAGGPAAQFRSLVEIQAPTQDRGKLMLKDGTNLWMFDPTSKATIRISPQQKLLGQAANGDVVTTNFAFDYDAHLEGEETIGDGDRKDVRCWKLALAARTPQTTYHHAFLWIAQDDGRPVKAQFFVESGTLLKTAFYRRMQPTLGMDRPTETVLIDGLDPHWITVMRFDQYAWRDIPETWLQRDYLSRFKPE
ncbi:outer membrane lipoprotein-sorting protein [Ralstonia sp. 1138]|uniref:outer membrane lipoprotein-sorting protein n=1 Tax=Ralstonia sp. 1138 TaxID=3156423 RepID=UPI003393D2ED